LIHDIIVKSNEYEEMKQKEEEIRVNLEINKKAEEEQRIKAEKKKLFQTFSPTAGSMQS
jgi:hypothetical protein